jgi:hypothetical protein
MMESALWETRLLGLVASNSLQADIRNKIMAKAAAKDVEPLVRTYAASALELAKTAATQPAQIAPATAPAVSNAGPPPEAFGHAGPPTQPTTQPSPP